MKLWEKLNAEIVSCEKCPRLVAYRQWVVLEKKREFRSWDYWGKPITGFGDLRAKILLVGLAPAAHGGNRTGRIFTGDGSAQTLMRTLHAVGLASQPFSLHRDDGLKLSLGQIAFSGTLKALEELARQRGVEWQIPKPRSKFAHGAHCEIPDPRGGTLQLLASYHPSRQNTQTGRLTIQMLVDVLSRAKALAGL